MPEPQSVEVPQSREPIPAVYEIDLDIYDPQALSCAAFARGRRDGMSDEDLVDMLGPADAPQLDQCLIQLLDPGMIAGACVQSSTADLRGEQAPDRPSIAQ